MTIKRQYGWVACLLLVLTGRGARGDFAVIPREEAYEELHPAKSSQVQGRPSELTGRVMVGYQGWFRAEGDGSGMGFEHYSQQGRFEPGFCTIDFWPELSEFEPDELYETPFQHRDGRSAKVFSSINPKTVDRHFAWMADYGIDGPFVQRFGVHGAANQKDYRSLKFENRKLVLCRNAAIRHQRCWALMYDLSGLQDADFDRLADDWKHLRRDMRLGDDPNDSAYLQFRGKPLVAIWGVGFADDRGYGLEKVAWFIRLLRDNPEWGGMSIMLGVPYHWREQINDSVTVAELHDVLRMADVMSPWSVGRFRNAIEDMNALIEHQRADMAWCQRWGVDYLPVVWPGFSWQNMMGQHEKSTTISREGGAFLWAQFRAAAMAGNTSAYVAMFDEIDEGTAIFKCTNDPPIGASKFQTFGADPPDHYLWLVGEGGQLLRGDMPQRKSCRKLGPDDRR